MLDGLESESAGRVCVMMTAMNVANLPPALVRSGRVELWLEMKLPDAEARGQILTRHLGELPEELRQADAAALIAATENFTGADLKRLVEDGKQIRGSNYGSATPAIDFPRIANLYVDGRLPLDLLPSIVYPNVRANITNRGVEPEVLEETVAKPLEASLATTENLARLETEIQEGRVGVNLHFAYGTDIDFALQDASKNLDRVRAALASGAAYTEREFTLEQFGEEPASVDCTVTPATLAGMRGAFGDWNWESAFATAGTHSVTYQTVNVNLDGFAKAFGPFTVDPGTGLVGAVQAQARGEDRWSLDGQCPAVPYAAEADLLLVPAEHGGSVGVFLVEPGAGLDVLALRSTNRAPLGQVTFEGTSARVLVAPGDEFAAVMASRNEPAPPSSVFVTVSDDGTSAHPENSDVLPNSSVAVAVRKKPSVATALIK